MDYWDGPMGARRRDVILHMLPTYVSHMAVPRKWDGTRTGLRGRHAAALFDSCVDQLLRAYGELTGITLRAGTSRMVILYMGMLSAFNREYEYRLATSRSLELTKVLEAPHVFAYRSRWTAFTPVAAGFWTRPDVVADYARYVQLTTASGFAEDPAAQLESIDLDSAGYLGYLAELIGTFHNRPADREVIRQFRHFGTAAKLADELCDLLPDYREGRYNLLLAWASQDAHETRKLRTRLNGGQPAGPAWWMGHAPHTFAAFTTEFDRHYRAVTSRPLHRLCDAGILRPARTTPAARDLRPVFRPPQEAWR